MPFFLFIFGITCYDFHQGQAQKKIKCGLVCKKPLSIFAELI